VESFSIIDGASESGTLRLTFSGALGIYSLAEELLFKKNSLKAQFSPELCRVLIAITSYLTEKQDIFNKKTNLVF